MTQPDELSSMDLVTEVTTTGVAPELDRAVQVADAAARSAGVSVRELKDLAELHDVVDLFSTCLLYTSPSPRDRTRSRMPSSA